VCNANAEFGRGFKFMEKVISAVERLSCI